MLYEVITILIKLADRLHNMRTLDYVRPAKRRRIAADGTLTGWVGGSCAQPTVSREALTALHDGRNNFV